MEKSLRSLILKYLDDIKGIRSTKKYAELISNERKRLLSQGFVNASKEDYVYKVQFDDRSKKFKTVDRASDGYRNMMDTLVDMIGFVANSGQNDRYDRLFNRLLKVVWALIHNNLFDIQVPAFIRLFDSLVKIRQTGRSQNIKAQCKAVMHSLFKALTDRLRLQFLYFRHSNPTKYFYSNEMKGLVKRQTSEVFKGLIDQVVLGVESQTDNCGSELEGSAESVGVKEGGSSVAENHDIVKEDEEKLEASGSIKNDEIASGTEAASSDKTTDQVSSEANKEMKEESKPESKNDEALVSNKPRPRYFTSFTKAAMSHLPSSSSNLRVDLAKSIQSPELENERKHTAGVFGWCRVCRKTAHYICKEKRVSICSVECKLRLVEGEETFAKMLKKAKQEENREKNFHKDFLKIFEALADRCFDSGLEKERLLFLNLLYSILKEPFGALKADPRFISFVKEKVFPNLMKIALNNEEEVLVICLRIFVSLVENFRRFLRREIGVFLEDVCLKMLDSANSKFVYKYYLLQVLTYLVEKNLLAFELFLNFDCRTDSANLCQRIIDLLVKTCQGRFSRNIYKDMVSAVEENVLKKEASKAIVKLIRNCSMLLHKAEKEVLGEAPKGLSEVLERKQKLEEAIAKFNAGKKRGLIMLRELGVVDETAESLAKFLAEETRLAQSQIGEVFGGDDEFSLKVLEVFLENLDFKGVDVLDAVKRFLSMFELPGEGQKIERILEAFAKRMVECNPENYSEDACFQLAFLLIMIHTNTYNDNVIDKLNLANFQSMGKDILNMGEPVPPETVADFYNRIKAEPLALHASERRKKEIQETLSRTFREKEERFKKESLQFINTFWDKVKTKAVTEDYQMVKSYSVLQVFLKSIWTSLLAFFSTSIAGTEDIERLRDLVDATMSMIKLCDVFGMQTERNSFLTILVQFSGLDKTYGRPFSEKNLLFIQSVLDIATKEGNHLRSGWGLVLNCVVALNAFHQHAESLLASNTNMQGNATSLTVKDQNSLFVRKNFARDSLKKLFADSTKLSEESLLFFLEGLAKLSVKELEKMEEGRFAYTIEEMMNVFHSNLYRNPLTWLRVWKVINSLFDEIVSKTSDGNISLVLLSSNCLKNLVSISFSTPNLLKNRYQSHILELYVTILSNPNLRPDYLNFSLLTLMDLLRKSGDDLKGGAKELIAILNLAEEMVFRHMNLPNVQKGEFEEIGDSMEATQSKFDQLDINGKPEKPNESLVLTGSPKSPKYLDITGTLYLEVLQDILQILKFIFSNFHKLLEHMKEHLTGLMNVIINLTRKTNLEVVFTSLEHQEILFNYFWNETGPLVKSAKAIEYKICGELDGNNKAKSGAELEVVTEEKEESELDSEIKNTEGTEAGKNDEQPSDTKTNNLDSKETYWDHSQRLIAELRENPRHLVFRNVNLYYQQFIHPSLKSLIVYSKWHSQEDFKNAVNRLFEMLHRLEKHLDLDSWKTLFEDVFFPLLQQTVAKLDPHVRNKFLQDFREIVLFTLKNMYSFCLHHETLPLELIEMNFEVLLRVCRGFRENNKFFLEILILNLSQNISDTARLKSNIWVDDIWAVLIRFLKNLFKDHVPLSLVENSLFGYIKEFMARYEARLEAARASPKPPSLPIDTPKDSKKGSQNKLEKGESGENKVSDGKNETMNTTLDTTQGTIRESKLAGQESEVDGGQGNESFNENTPEQNLEDSEEFIRINSNSAVVSKEMPKVLDLNDPCMPEYNCDSKKIETQCRFILNLMKLIEQIFKNTQLLESSSQSLIGLTAESQKLASAFNGNVLFRFVFWKKSNFTNRDCLPSLHSFEISVLRARFLYLKKLYSADNADLITFFIDCFKTFGARFDELRKAVRVFKSRRAPLFSDVNDSRDFALHRLSDSQTRALFLFDFVNSSLVGYLLKTELQYFESESQARALIDACIDYLAAGPSLFAGNLLKCVECLSCHKCYAKTTKQRRALDLSPVLKSLIGRLASLDFVVVSAHSLNVTPNLGK